MNIHFKDKNLFESLKNATLAKVRIGSHLYGTNNEHSDKDFLYIYATSENELKSFVWTHHQLQYKEEGIDHNFVSLHSFVRNIINGDSTINFEVVHSDELSGTWLYLLHELRESFNTYTIARSYNGFAKRDYKYWNKAKTIEEKRKKLEHIIRGYLYCDKLMNGYTHNIFTEVNLELQTKIIEMSTMTIEELLGCAMKIFQSLERQRTELNNRLDHKTLRLPKIMDVQKGLQLNWALSLLQKGSDFKEHQAHLTDFDMTYYIDAFENWVHY